MTAIEGLRAMAWHYELNHGFPPREIALTGEEAIALARELAEIPTRSQFDEVPPEELVRKMRQHGVTVGGIKVTTK